MTCGEALVTGCGCSGRVAFETDMGGVDSLKSEEATTHDKLEITHAAMDEVFLILIERGLRYYRFWDAVSPLPSCPSAVTRQMGERGVTGLRAQKSVCVCVGKRSVARAHERRPVIPCPPKISLATTYCPCQVLHGVYIFCTLARILSNGRSSCT